MSPRYPRPTELAILGQRRLHGSTAYARQDKAGGRRCRWVPRGTATRRINPYRPSPATELLISPDGLIEDRLLRTSDCDGKSFSAASVDYDLVIPFKNRLLETAWNKFSAGARPDLRSDFDRFCHGQAHWLDDYALFQTLKAKYKGAYYLEWPAELVQRTPAALALARRELADQIERVRFAQFLLLRQGKRLKGTCPFQGCAPDRRPALFRLPRFERRVGQPGAVPAGFAVKDRGSSPVCLQTISAAQGQLWGNPVFDWGALRRTGYRWCIDRLRALLAHVD